MKLFALRDLSNGRIVPDMYFASKEEAKTKRDQMGGPTAFCVTYGPDHWRVRV